MPLRGYNLPWKPAPASYSPTRRVIQPEVVRIANTCDFSKQSFASEVVWLDVIDARYPSEVILVEAEASNRGGCERDG
jgi:hypothetical protein